MSKLTLNPVFDRDEFLRTTWQQKPALLPQLVPNFKDLISPSELAGLACEELVESRLITEPKPGKWSVQHGPFIESDFTSLPEMHWTVLVQAVDQWLDEVAALRALFEFIPRWRIDDVMISYAADEGGVGPHFDHYDVFLLQGSGQRLWRTGGKVAADVELDNQDGVGILRSFVAEQEFILNPGDALYIPPQYAHWGQSLGASTCYSIGFRAPALSEMLEGFSDALIADCLPSQRYIDAECTVPAHPASIDPVSVAANFRKLSDRLNSPGQFERWFGCWVTRPKYPELREPPRSLLNMKAMRKALAAGRHFKYSSTTRFAFLAPLTGNSILLFADGDVFELPRKYVDVIQQLCEPTMLKQMDFSNIEESSPLLAALLQLRNQGSLRLS